MKQKDKKSTVNVSYLACLCFSGKWFLNKLAKIWFWSAFLIVPIHLHTYFTFSDVIELKRRSFKKRWIGYTAKCTCYTLTVKSDVWNVVKKSALNVTCCAISIYRSYNVWLCAMHVLSVCQVVCHLVNHIICLRFICSPMCVILSSCICIMSVYL